MEIKTRIGGVMMNVVFSFVDDAKRDHYAGQAAVTAIASAIKTAADKASVKGMTESEVVAAALKLKAPDGLTGIVVTTIGGYVPKTQSAEAKVLEERKAAFDRAVAAGLSVEVARLVSGYVPATKTAPATTIGEQTAATMELTMNDDVES